MRGLIEKFKQLESTQQTKIKRSLFLIGIVVVVMGFYYGTGRDEKVVVEAVNEKDIRLSESLLEDDISTKVENKLSEKDFQDKAQDEQIDNLNAKYQQLLVELEKQKIISEDVLENQTSADTTPSPKPSINFPPPPTTLNNNQAGGNYPAQIPIDQIEPVLVGSIGHSAGIKEDDLGTKKNKGIRLPPGFMEGTLLTGIEADALADAAGEPEPIMIRVDSPTVLPNRLKADLKGCFVVASAHGKINKERVEGRLVALHCIRKNGHGAVEADLKGYIADQDGKKGMTGIVVSKAGPLVLRSAMAGAISGVGDAVSQSAATTTITGSGVATSIDGDQITRSALGSGVGRAADKLNDIFLEYIKQTTPVIEVGTHKIVTIVLTEPTMLNIIDIEQE
jgi:conjugal transfer pilus assembly protein TraB